MRTPLTSRILLAVGALMLAIEGTWSVPLHSSALFVIYALVFLLSLALVLLHRVTSHTHRSKAEVGFLLNHLGIFIIVWAALFGAPDVSRSRMIVPRGSAVNYAHAADGTVVPLPFNVALENFRIDYYDDNVTPRHLQDKRGWRPFALLLLAFMALQITWYGVNYLPSAMDSLHTYMR